MEAEEREKECAWQREEEGERGKRTHRASVRKGGRKESRKQGDRREGGGEEGDAGAAPELSVEDAGSYASAPRSPPLYYYYYYYCYYYYYYYYCYYYYYYYYYY